MSELSFDDLAFDEPVAYPTRHRHFAEHTDNHVWVFNSTDGAYNTTQVDDRISDGDILLVPSENVAGWLERAWPTAATPNAAGAFHRIKPGCETPDTDAATTLALEVWAEYQGLPVRSHIDGIPTEREMWDALAPRLGSVVLIVPNKYTKFTHDRLATLVDLRIDTSDTQVYVKNARYVHDRAYLDHAGAFAVATLKYLDTGKKVYTVNPRYLRDPETRRRLVDMASAGDKAERTGLA